MDEVLIGPSPDGSGTAEYIIEGSEEPTLNQDLHKEGTTWSQCLYHLWIGLSSKEPPPYELSSPLIPKLLVH